MCCLTKLTASTHSRLAWPEPRGTSGMAVISWQESSKMAAARAAPARDAETATPRHPGALLGRREDASVRWLDARDTSRRSMIGTDPATSLTAKKLPYIGWDEVVSKIKVIKRHYKFIHHVHHPEGVRRRMCHNRYVRD